MTALVVAFAAGFGAVWVGYTAGVRAERRRREINPAWCPRCDGPLTAPRQPHPMRGRR